MHTVQLLLKTSKYERHEIDRRFHALAHLHNVCVKHARKCMIRLHHDKRYAELRQLYNELVKKEKMSKEEKSQKKKLAKQLAACRTEQGLSKASLEHYLDLCQYFEHKKLKGYADFFNSSSSFCCGVI